MKIGKKSILLFLSIISCCMLKQTLVMAEEYSECVQPQDKQELSVLEETDTSIVYDMGMVPAIELSVSTLVFSKITLLAILTLTPPLFWFIIYFCSTSIYFII